MTSETVATAVDNWRSILTLVIFILINVPILWPFRTPLYVPKVLLNGFQRSISALRLCQIDQDSLHQSSHFVRFALPVNYVTAPLTAIVLLLSTTSIGWQEIHSGVIGNEATNINPYDVVLVFLTLGYVANSIAASGFIRYLVSVVIKKTGRSGRRLYLFTYLSFFGLGLFVGNDPMMLLFLSSFIKVAENVEHPRAWWHTQFAVANIATGILVSSNPTNLVIAGAFNIRFTGYMANMAVPTLVTSFLLFPFLLYVIFHDNLLIPSSIKYYEIPDEILNKPPRNGNIPFSRDEAEDQDSDDVGPTNYYHAEEVLNPFLSKKDAIVGCVLMGSSILILLTLNAVYLSRGGNTDFWVTLPAASLMAWWDFVMGWKDREKTRKIAREGRKRAQDKKAERERDRLSTLYRKDDDRIPVPPKAQTIALSIADESRNSDSGVEIELHAIASIFPTTEPGVGQSNSTNNPPSSTSQAKTHIENLPLNPRAQRVLSNLGYSVPTSSRRKDFGKEPVTFVARLQDRYVWFRETYPQLSVAMGRLPWDIIPFAFSMFTIVEALVSKGWMPVFAKGWDWWATNTGVVGSIVGMSFLGAVLSNFAGTNIGASILLSQVVKAWQEIHRNNGIPISDRLFWGTVYSLSIGVNYGAFTLSISASLTGIMWRTLLHEEGRHMGRIEFARVNGPIVAMAMFIACSVLFAQVFIVRSAAQYDL